MPTNRKNWERNTKGKKVKGERQGSSVTFSILIFASCAFELSCFLEAGGSVVLDLCFV